MNNSSDDDWIIWAICGVVGVGAIVVWKFSTFFGLDMRTGANVLLRLVFWAAAMVGCVKFGDDFEFLSLRNSGPILAGVFVWCWFPALDFWAFEHTPAFLVRDEESAVWWATWYGKLLELTSVVGAGYAVRYTALR